MSLEAMGITSEASITEMHIPGETLMSRNDPLSLMNAHFSPGSSRLWGQCA